jgi:hypothetical protein
MGFEASGLFDMKLFEVAKSGKGSNRLHSEQLVTALNGMLMMEHNQNRCNATHTVKDVEAVFRISGHLDH